MSDVDGSVKRSDLEACRLPFVCSLQCSTGQFRYSPLKFPREKGRDQGLGPGGLWEGASCQTAQRIRIVCVYLLRLEWLVGK